MNWITYKQDAISPLPITDKEYIPKLTVSHAVYIVMFFVYDLYRTNSEEINIHCTPVTIQQIQFRFCIFTDTQALSWRLIQIIIFN